ncbi:entry exclusion protein 1, partial [Escherichia coli]|nr:entry exclusion protein 1 [Escherichia coli]
RSQFDRVMRTVLASYLTSHDGRRAFEPSDLTRAYGELKLDEPPERHTAGQAHNPQDHQTQRMVRELNELDQCLPLTDEDKDRH